MPDPTLVDLATHLPIEVTVGAKFGKPTLKDPAGKAFACLFNGDLACRLGRDTDSYTAALALPGAHLFDPSARDRPMKDWVSHPQIQRRPLARLHPRRPHHPTLNGRRTCRYLALVSRRVHG